MMRTMWGDHDRFIETYFLMFENLYFTGDGCRIDDDGDYWLMGRIDDVVNVSGHRIGTAEVESALVSHNKVAEAAVAGGAWRAAQSRCSAKMASRSTSERKFKA